MFEEKLQIKLADGQSISAVQTSVGRSPSNWLFVYAPGAGSNIDDAFGLYASETIAAQGIIVVRFQFPYMEIKGRRPDSPSILEETWREVIESVRSRNLNIVIGGRSMGGRIASQVAAKGVQVQGLALFAYPLHPPGEGSRWRDKHLHLISMPTLFCSGTRDNFATPDELRTAADKVQRAQVHLLEGADHGFSVLKSSNRTREDVWNEAISTFVGWLQT